MKDRVYSVNVGERFERLLVIGPRIYVTGGYKIRVRCDCGNEKVVYAAHLKRGYTKSCGCIQREMMVNRKTTHGETGTPLFNVWMSMKERCRNPNVRTYHRYGGRGISVSEEWNLYENFRDWAHENGYEAGLEIDRIDNNGNYSPDNCRWATRKQNTRNTSKTIFLNAFGERKSLADWAEDDRCVVERKTLWRRLKDGWNVEDAIARVPR